MKYPYIVQKLEKELIARQELRRALDHLAQVALNADVAWDCAQKARAQQIQINVIQRDILTRKKVHYRAMKARSD